MWEVGCSGAGGNRDTAGGSCRRRGERAVGRGVLWRQHDEGWWCGVGEGEPLLAKVLVEPPTFGGGEGRRSGPLGLKVCVRAPREGVRSAGWVCEQTSESAWRASTGWHHGCRRGDAGRGCRGRALARSLSGGWGSGRARREELWYQEAHRAALPEGGRPRQRLPRGPGRWEYACGVKHRASAGSAEGSSVGRARWKANWSS